MAGVLKGIFPVNLGIKPKELIGIDLSANFLKIAQVKILPNKKELVELSSRRILGLSDDELARLVAMYFSGLKTKNPSIINVIPSSLIITKNIEIPSTDPKEIREIINLQAGRHTPYSREEIAIDYINIGTYKHSYTKILLVIVARKVIKRQFEIFYKAGLKVDKVVLATEGLARFISKTAGLDTLDLPCAIVYVDDNSTDFIVIFKTKAIFIRSIPIGAEQLISGREKYEARFTDELKRSLEAYQSENIEKNPNTLILTGAVTELKYLEGVLNDSLHLPVRAVSQIKDFSISERASKEIGGARDFSFLNVIAAVSTHEELNVNLIPDEIKLRKLVEERGRDLIKTGILVLAIFVLLFSLLISKIYFKSAYLKKLDVKYSQINKEARELEENHGKINAVKKYLQRRGYGLEVLTELYGIMPLDLKLAEIKFEEQGKLTVRGTAESMSLVFSFVDTMEKSKYFKDVKTKYTTKRKEGLKDFTDFEITCQLEREGVS